MLVHGGTPSPFARKVLVALEEEGLSYESKRLAPFPKTPELLLRKQREALFLGSRSAARRDAATLTMNPLGKIPILELSDGTYIPDSSVICAYLEKICPERRFLQRKLAELPAATLH